MAQGFTLLRVLFAVPADLGERNFGRLVGLLTQMLAWHLFSLLDLAFGLSHANEDSAPDVLALAGYRWATLLWAPFQFVTIFCLLIYVSQSGHLNLWEQLGLFYSLGVMSGTIGINYRHEMMHHKTAVERGMADLLLAMVLYSHFRSEHLLVHHRYVGTPRDPVTARYNESFYKFFPRVLTQCFFLQYARSGPCCAVPSAGFSVQRIHCCDMLHCRLAL